MISATDVLSRQLIYASGFTVLKEGVTWISEGFVDLIICQSASLFFFGLSFQEALCVRIWSSW